MIKDIQKSLEDGYETAVRRAIEDTGYAVDQELYRDMPEYNPDKFQKEAEVKHTLLFRDKFAKTREHVRTIFEDSIADEFSLKDNARFKLTEQELDELVMLHLEEDDG